MATFNIIEWALREIKTAVKNGEDIDDAKWAVEAMCRVENLSNEVHDIKDRYDSEAVWRAAKKQYLANR